MTEQERGEHDFILQNEKGKRAILKPADIADFIMSCLAEAEADGYQQQKRDPIHEWVVTFGRINDKELWFRVGDEQEFIVSVRKIRQAVQQGGSRDGDRRL